MSSDLQERGERALEIALPARLRGLGRRVDVVQKDGTMLVHIQDPIQVHDPLSLLRDNARPAKVRIRSHMVVDPRTGRPAKRYAIPYRIWSKEELLRRALEGEERGQVLVQDGSSIRQMKGISGQVNEYRYGRSERLAILFDRRPLVLAAGVFPGGMYESGLLVTPPRLAGAAWVLLARSGVNGNPYSYHVLRNGSFFRVERAQDIPGKITQEALKSMEHALIRSVEEDREILSELLHSRGSWEVLLPSDR